ncbi:MAG: 50S ribosomal protein L6 [Pseudomonadales bacterium]|nr:50S ribosomal protein L6 [Pseudomonadales bacterium]
MSRVAKSPVELPSGVTVTMEGSKLTVKGGKASLDLEVHASVEIKEEDGKLTFVPKTDKDWAMAGTFRALVNNMVVGVTTGFEKKLQLIGVGYRAKASGKSINLTLGFSHPVDYALPEGITAETPSQTEVVIKGADKQKVGQVASEIRAFRPPEPYKGKGVRYSDEFVRRKEAKKK